MKFNRSVLLLIVAGIFSIASVKVIADDFPFKKQIKARQAFMQVYAYNLGLLGAMAKGESEYNAEIASGAANNLMSLVKMSNSTMWPQGSSAADDGLDGKTRAKGEIWSSFPEVGEKHKALADAISKMASEAGNGLDAVKANMGGVGKGCKGCHESFRVPKDQ